MKRKKILKFTENILLISYMAYLVLFSLKITTFMILTLPWLDQLIFWPLFFSVIIRVFMRIWDGISHFLSQYNSYKTHSPTNKASVSFVCLQEKTPVPKLILNSLWRERKFLACIFIGWLFNYAGTDAHYQPLSLIIIGSAGIPYRRILKSALISVGCVVSVCTLVSMADGIQSFTGLKGSSIRSYMGSISPTDYGTIVTFLFMGLWVLLKDLPAALCLVFPAISMFFSVYITRCYTSALCSILLAAAVVYCGIEKAISNTQDADKSCVIWASIMAVRKIVDFCLQAAFPVLMSVTFFLTWAYGKGYSFAYRANTLLSSRLMLSSDYIREHGISAFGEYFPGEGNGGTTYSVMKYTFVDVSYIRILLYYGVVTLAFVCIMWVIMTRRAILMGDRRLAFALAIIAFDACSEHHFMEMNYNFFIAMPLAEAAGNALINKKIKDKEYIKVQQKLKSPNSDKGLGIIPGLMKKTYASKIIKDVLAEIHSRNGRGTVVKWGIYVIGICACFMLLPLVLSWARVINAWGQVLLSDKYSFALPPRENRHQISMFLAAVLVLLLFIAALHSLGEIAKRIAEGGGIFINNSSKSNRIIEGSTPHTRDIEANDNPRMIRHKNRGSFSCGSAAPFVIFLFCMISFLILGLYADSIINKALILYDPVMENDRDAIADIIENKEGKFYVARLGELYKRKFNVKIDQSFFDGQDLARFDKITVLTEEDADYPVFFSRGFLYAKVSGDHAIYTNDKYLIDALRYKGYHFTAYCPAVYDNDKNIWYDVKGRKESSLNLKAGIIYSSSGLYSGQYTATYDLKIDALPYDKDYVVGNLKIYAYSGKKCIRDVSLYRSWFDKSGKLKAKVPFAVGSYPNMEYVVLPYNDIKNENDTKESKTTTAEERDNKNTNDAKVYNDNKYNLSKVKDIEVSGIKWQRTPYYDIHHVYDQYHYVIEDDYHSIENGGLADTLEGYAKRKYIYDDARRIAEIQYCDKQGFPVNTSDGYAFVKYFDNFGNQKIKESYLDKNRNPVMAIQGFSSFTCEYDNMGDAVCIKYYDDKDKPVMTEYGFSEIRREFNEDHLPVSEMYYGTDGLPAALDEGYYGVSISYNDDDLPKKITYLDADSKTIEREDGFSISELTFNEEGKVIQEAYCDRVGYPSKRYGRVSYTELARNIEGDVWIYRYLDEEKKPVNGLEGYSELRHDYDEHGRVIRESYFNEKQKPVEIADGFSVIEFEYGKGDNIAKQSFYDCSGRLVRQNNGEESEMRQGREYSFPYCLKF